jgi:hypothetical protein
MTTWLNDQAEVERLRARAARAELKLTEAIIALHLIAMPKRQDGTYNRSREACEQLAATALEEIYADD